MTLEHDTAAPAVSVERVEGVETTALLAEALVLPVLLDGGRLEVELTYLRGYIGQQRTIKCGIDGKIRQDLVSIEARITNHVPVRSCQPLAPTL